MTLNYKDLKPVIVELANINEDNIKKGVTSTPLKLIPAFIMTDNTIYYMTTDHCSANFYEELEMSLNIIGKKQSLSLEKIGVKENLILLRNNLLSDYQKFLNNDISAGDVRYYLNMNCLEIFRYNPNLKNIYSLDCRNVLLMLLNSKIQIYDYFLKLYDECDDMVKLLINHPNINVSEVNFEKIIENAKKIGGASNDLEYKAMLNTIISNLHDLSKNKLIHLTYKDFMQDFAVSTIGIDKIETQLNKTITTTKLNPSEFYFNYLIMGYNIVQIPKVVFDKQKQSFRIIDVNEYSIASNYNEKYKEEAKLIIKKVPYSERYKYFI